MSMQRLCHQELANSPKLSELLVHQLPRPRFHQSFCFLSHDQFESKFFFITDNKSKKIYMSRIIYTYNFSNAKAKTNCGVCKGHNSS